LEYYLAGPARQAILDGFRHTWAATLDESGRRNRNHACRFHARSKPNHRGSNPGKDAVICCKYKRTHNTLPYHTHNEAVGMQV
jgi:hypothetical protein